MGDKPVRNWERVELPGEGMRYCNALFIVFEGIDGSGKSTQARLLADRFKKEGTDVVLTVEPSDGPIGRFIRALASRPEPEEESRLFTQDRRHHVEHVIKPALVEGKVVICDRYIYSSMAYQGARGLDPDRIFARNVSFAVLPDVVFLLEIPVEKALERISAGRSGKYSLFERRKDLEVVDAIYRSLSDPAIIRIEATFTETRVHDLVVEALKGLKKNSSLIEALP